MSIESDIFSNYMVIPEKLVQYGFAHDGEKLVYTVSMPRGNFCVIVEYTKNEISGKIIDTAMDSEYTNFRIENDFGYAANVRQRFIDILTDIRDKCTINQHFSSPTARHIARFIHNEFNVSPEFLWEKFPSFAIFRRTDNKKWFVLIANIPLVKLKSRANTRDIVDIINVKVEDTKTRDILKKRGFYPAYHMNKTSWVTIILDGTVPDATVEQFIRESFTRA